MEKRIIIISSGHPSMDERIFWKFGLSLSGNGYEVQITTSCEELNTIKENITISSFNGNNISKKEKINRFFLLIKDFNPDLIICCEPFPILAAYKFKKTKKSCKIISDITEWYPYRSHYMLYKGLRRVLIYISQYFFNIYATNLADHLIIGEELKVNRYRIFAPLKKRTIIGYFPPIKLFHFYKTKPKQNEICICYCGTFNQERGFERLLKLAYLFATQFNHIKLKLLLVGSFESPQEKIKYINSINNKNIVVVHKEWTDYDSYPLNLKEADICIDLRSDNNMRNNSIPIKIFDYIAVGKPIIFPSFKSLLKIKELSEFGHFVKIDDYNLMIKIIAGYLENPQLLIKHSLAARQAFESKFNWEILEKKLLNLIANLISNRK